MATPTEKLCATSCEHPAMPKNMPSGWNALAWHWYSLAIASWKKEERLEEQLRAKTRGEQIKWDECVRLEGELAMTLRRQAELYEAWDDIGETLSDRTGERNVALAENRKLRHDLDEARQVAAGLLRLAREAHRARGRHAGRLRCYIWTTEAEAALAALPAGVRRLVEE